MKNEIILYQPDEIAEHIEVRIDEENELDKNSVVAFFATTATDGKTYNVEHFNLDAILSVGYRVNSKRGTQFRIWANGVLKDYLIKGYAINVRVNRLEENFQSLKSKVNKIDLQFNSNLIPTQGVFFDRQIFDAYELASRIIRAAQKEIMLIDNYIDESTLTHLSKKAEKVKVILLTKSISKQLALDVKKANQQYGNFEVNELSLSHDRFLITDQQELYHLGASLKDLGKKWFAFSQMDESITKLIVEQINKERK